MDQPSISMSENSSSGSTTVSEELFFQTIFPPVKKEPTKLISFDVPKPEKNSSCGIDEFGDVGATIYCGMVKDWVSLVACISCTVSNRSLEDILQDEFGCFPDKNNEVC